ncbi:MAG: hypothetical protein ABIN67_14410 [Ferruginibacter sp.]
MNKIKNNRTARLKKCRLIVSVVLCITIAPVLHTQSKADTTSRIDKVNVTQTVQPVVEEKVFVQVRKWVAEKQEQAPLQQSQDFIPKTGAPLEVLFYIGLNNAGECAFEHFIFSFNKQKQNE